MNPTHYIKHDDYCTQKSTWASIINYIPSYTEYWEPFYCDGSSGKHLSELGLTVIHNNEDFFDNDHGDIIISNPPFSKKKAILDYIWHLQKPFIMIMPASVLSSRMYERFIPDTTIIIPKNRIQFSKNGIVNQNQCPFDCYFYCWKLDLNDRIIKLI
jgi:hypothetical protein